MSYKVKLCETIWIIDIQKDDIIEGIIRKPIRTVVRPSNIEEIQKMFKDGRAFKTHKEAWGETMSIVIRGYKDR